MSNCSSAVAAVVVWEWIRNPVAREVRAAARTIFACTSESSPSFTAILMNPGLMPVPPMPPRASSIHSAASSSAVASCAQCGR